MKKISILLLCLFLLGGYLQAETYYLITKSDYQKLHTGRYLVEKAYKKLKKVTSHIDTNREIKSNEMFMIAKPANELKEKLDLISKWCYCEEPIDKTLDRIEKKTNLLNDRITYMENELILCLGMEFNTNKKRRGK